MNFKGYHEVRLSEALYHLGQTDLIRIARELFGDNDPFMPYNKRRWTTATCIGNRSILIRDEQDLMWLQLKLKEYHVKAR